MKTIHRIQERQKKTWKHSPPPKVFSILIIITAVMLLLVSCFAPVSTRDQGISLDVSMGSRGLPTGDTVVLAGLLINSGFEDTLKDVTQLMVALDSGQDPFTEQQMEDRLEEILLNVALGGTMKFSGNPYFAIEVDYDDIEHTADFAVTGIPADKDYFLYMGGFNTIDDVKQFFGLMEESAEYDEDSINYSHIFYLEGEDLEGTVTVPFEVEGVDFSGDFTVSTGGLYEGTGWYYVEPWYGGLSTGVKATAGQPFTVRPGETTTVTVYLTDDIAE